jgi:acyl carrier protein
MTPEQAQQQIRRKVIELAREIGRDAGALTNDQILPRTGYLDSAAIMGLIAWYELTFHLDIPQEDLTIDNFGSVNQMVAYAQRHAS